MDEASILGAVCRESGRTVLRGDASKDADLSHERPTTKQLTGRIALVTGRASGLGRAAAAAAAAHAGDSRRASPAGK
jgi:hypothetical protein